MLKCYDKAIEFAYDEGPWLNKGIYYVDLEEYSKALKCFDEAITINENNDQLWQLKGECYMDMLEINKAKTCFKKALDINPYNDFVKNELLYL